MLSICYNIIVSRHAHYLYFFLLCHVLYFHTLMSRTTYSLLLICHVIYHHTISYVISMSCQSHALTPLQLKLRNGSSIYHPSIYAFVGQCASELIMPREVIWLCSLHAANKILLITFSSGTLLQNLLIETWLVVFLSSSHSFTPSLLVSGVKRSGVGGGGGESEG